MAPPGETGSDGYRMASQTAAITDGGLRHWMADRFAFSPETLIKAYSLGVFPMADSADSREIKFYDPEARALIPLAWREGARHEFHLPRRLARTVRQQPFTVTIDRDFPP